MADAAGLADEAASPSEQTRRTRPIAFYLAILAVVALLPAFIFSAFLLQRNNEAQEQVVETLVTGTARSILQTIEREIGGSITTMRVLATTPSLQAGDFETFHDRVTRALAGTDTYAFLLDADQLSVLSTRTPFGSPPRLTNDPESAKQARETGQPVVSNAVIGAVSGQWIFNILLPVEVEGQGTMVLALNRSASGLAAALLSRKLPDGWNVALVDNTGTVIAASPGAAEPGEHLALGDAVPPDSSAGWIPVRLDGENLLTVVQRSALASWTLYAWAPHELITRPLANAFWSLLVGGVLLAALVALVIYWVSLQIARSVRGLAEDARLLGAGEVVPARDYPISEIVTVSASIADASRRRKAAETEVRLLMRELAHRSKNQLAVISAMAKQSAKGAVAVDDFVIGFDRRLHSLARSTDLLLAHGVAGVELSAVLSRQIDPLCPLDSGRVVIAGPKVRISTQSAQILGMAAHELATNAVKYGAFATGGGHVHVSWRQIGDRLELIWRESGASVEQVSARRGFGTTVLETMVRRSLNSDVTRTLHDDGIQWTFLIPLAALEVGSDPEAEAAAEK